jgi:acetyl-CoA acetyltransferase
MRQPEGREVVIVEAVRTPIGRGHREKGYYKDIHPNALLGAVYTDVIKRAGIDAAQVEDVIATRGCRRGCRSRRPARPSIASAARRSRLSTSPPA